MVNTWPESEWISIGEVTAPHGLRGAVRIAPLTDVPDRFELVERVYVYHPKADHKERKVLHVEKVHYHKKQPVVQFAEITTIDDAERIRSALLQVPLEETAPLSDDEYYVFQLIGLAVQCVDGTHVGYVRDVLTGTGASDVYVVARDDDEPAFIPAVREFIKKIDLTNKCIVIDPIPGLL